MTEGRSGGPSRVLLVEDDDMVAEGLRLLLEMEGITVDRVDCGIQAFDAVARFHPDVVLLDLALPDIDGTEVYGRLAAQWPEIPVVFSSGHAGAHTLPSSWVLKPQIEFLQKPYGVDVLMAAVRRAHSGKAAPPSTSAAADPLRPVAP